MPKRKPQKFIFVTGGVVSSLGKGLCSASIGALLENRGLKISIIKLDPYINVDPGTMSPLQHGEVFVTDDGAETDLDLGHYERYTNCLLTKNNNFTSGQIYNSVITKERRGEYLGTTVQVIPHITNEIKGAIRLGAQDADLAIVEIGGTVGDIESLPFLEAIRQMRRDAGEDNVLYVHCTLVPYLKAAGEVKTKPTQHSVNELRRIGIQPNILVCRSEDPIHDDIKRKISLFCDVDMSCVVSAPDVACIYEVPVRLYDEGLDDKISELLNIWSRGTKLDTWRQIVNNIKNPQYETVIGIVGKYTSLVESYKSLHEALVHGGIPNEARVELRYIDAEDVDTLTERLNEVDGILVPGGFGQRGSEGKILASKYARENRVPYFGICLGLQMAVVDFCRHVLELKDANSVEFNNKTAHPVIHLMDSQKEVVDKGATMRLGAYPCELESDSVAHKEYGRTEISERHRHRYEINNRYRHQLKDAGMIPSGTSPDGDLVEIVEIRDHPWFLGCQFHPEFKSKPFRPHPLFSGFIKASLGHGGFRRHSEESK